MKITKFEAYLDGGTIGMSTDKGEFYFDDRIKTKTRGRLYSGYPKE